MNRMIQRTQVCEPNTHPVALMHDELRKGRSSFSIKCCKRGLHGVDIGIRIAGMECPLLQNKREIFVYISFPAAWMNDKRPAEAQRFLFHDVETGVIHKRTGLDEVELVHLSLSR